MTAKDFRLIADTIAHLPIGGTGTDFTTTHRRILAERFANALAETNPRFDRGRFLAASERTGVNA